MNNHRGVLFGGGARRVVVQGDESDEDECNTAEWEAPGQFVPAVPRNAGSITETRTQSRLVVPKTVERQDRRKSTVIAAAVRPLRMSIPNEFLPSMTTGNSRLSIVASRNQSHRLASSSSINCGEAFLLSWANSVLELGNPSVGGPSPSSLNVYTNKDVLRDHIKRQWASMEGTARDAFAGPIERIAQRFAKNPLKVAKGMESVVRTAVMKHACMHALGTYSRIWFDAASDLLASDPKLRLALALQEKEWLEGLRCRGAGKSARLQAFSKLSPEGYCRVCLHVLAVSRLLDFVFTSSVFMIPVWAPPLFCESTCTVDVLQSTVGAFLEETDVHRWLKRYGYCVSYFQPQKILSSSSVENLAVDLRDGVVLCRLAELVVPGCERLKPLHPTSNTAERICNIELALTKLGMHGFIEARRIADGEQAATTGLLWNCILRFELERTLNFNQISAEVTRIGGGVVVGCPKVEIHDAYLRTLLLDDTTLSAASHVLRWVCCLFNSFGGDIISEDTSDHPLGGRRGRIRVLESLAYHYCDGWTSRVSKSPSSILAKINFLLKPLGADRGMPMIFSEAELLYSDEPLDQRLMLVTYALLAKRVLAVHLEQRAASIIQRCWRRHLTDQGAPEFARNHLKMWIDAATIIQRNVRPFLARQRIKASRAFREAFVERIVRVQSIWRQKMHVKHFVSLRCAAIAIQTQWRAHAARVELAARAQRAAQETAAAVTIQTHWKAAHDRKAFLVIRDAVTVISSTWRMIHTRKAFLDKRQAALVVQNHTRRMIIERDLRAREEAAVIIQKHVRRALVERELHAQEDACVLIQAAWRAARDRNAFLEKRKAATTIATIWRMNLSRKTVAQRAAHCRRVVAVSDALRLATEDLVGALTDFATAARAEMRVDNEEQRRVQAAQTIQHAWREHLMMQSVRCVAAYLLDVYERASETVKKKEDAAREAAEMTLQASRMDAAACLIQNRWRDRFFALRASERLLQIYQTAKQTVHLNEQYGKAVVTIQAHTRAFLVRERHPAAAAFAAIRGQLQAATERSEVLRREGIDDPTTLGNMTRRALEGLRRGNAMPGAPVLQDLAQCLGSSSACCEQFIDGSGVQHLTSSLLKISRDKMREDCIEHALICLETLSACGRFSDRAGSVLLEKDGEDVKHLFQLLFQLKDSHELFHALISALCAVGKGAMFRRAVASSDELSGSLRGVHRALSVKQSQVASYLMNIEGKRGSEVSIANATRTLYRMEKQTAGLVTLMACLGVADTGVDRVDGIHREENSANIVMNTPLVSVSKTRSLTTPSVRIRTPVTSGTATTKGIPVSTHKTPRRVLGNISNLQLN